jgi:hypothetical protein
MIGARRPAGNARAMRVQPAGNSGAARQTTRARIERGRGRRQRSVIDFPGLEMENLRPDLYLVGMNRETTVM